VFLVTAEKDKTMNDNPENYSTHHVRSTLGEVLRLGRGGGTTSWASTPGKRMCVFISQ
jgi:hypothetical protein